MASSLSSLDATFARYVTWLLAVARYYGLQPVVTSTYRSYQEQAELYRRYQEGRSSLPAAPPGRSKHQAGLAVDIDLPNSRQYLPWLGAVWQSIGGRWFASDPVHFEAP